MKRRHLMQQTGGLIPILSLKSTQVNIVRSTRETGNIYGRGEAGWDKAGRTNDNQGKENVITTQVHFLTSFAQITTWL